jgi:hypothetical protein
MAKMYKLILPHGQKEITIGMNYGNVTFQDGQIMPESSTVKLFPDFFFEIPEVVEPKPVENLVEKWKEFLEAPVTENAKPVELLESQETPFVEQPAKKKAGRPFGAKTLNRKK